MDLLALAGFRAVRITQVLDARRAHALRAGQDRALQNVAAAAKLVERHRAHERAERGQQDDAADRRGPGRLRRVRGEPRASGARRSRILIVGNEPNLNRYWLPQFNADGTDAAAPAYEALLATDVRRAQGGLAGRDGARRRRLAARRRRRRRHPPHALADGLHPATWARRTARAAATTPIMDGFAFHPYEDNSSVAPSTGTHPNTTTIALADYDKLVALLGERDSATTRCRSGTTSSASSRRSRRRSRALYTNAEPATTKPVTEATQAAYYRQAVQLAFCQPNVRGLFLFHAVDERDLTGWQSGLYYADDTPKSSLAAVRLALEQSRRGVVAHCDGLQLTVHPKVVQRGAVLTLTCDLDCSYVAQLYRLPGKLLVAKHGRAVGGRADDAAAARADAEARRTACGSRPSRP